MVYIFCDYRYLSLQTSIEAHTTTVLLEEPVLFIVITVAIRYIYHSKVNGKKMKNKSVRFNVCRMNCCGGQHGYTKLAKNQFI